MDPAAGPRPGDALDRGTADWMARQRWFATKSRRIVDAPPHVHLPRLYP